MKIKNKYLRHIVFGLEITIATFLINLAYYFFYLPSNLCTGGVMGIAIIVHNPLSQLSWYSDSIFIYFLNGVLLLVGLFFLGKDFFIKTIYASLISPTLLLLLERTLSSDAILKYVPVSNWYIVSMVIGGVLTAIGLGICFRINATTGGMDILQKIMAKYMHIPYSKTMYFTDWLVILIGGFFVFFPSLEGYEAHGFYNFEGVMYGIISVILIGYIVDYIALNAKSRRTAYIITTKPDEVKNAIYESLERGVTECDVRGGYTKENKVMLICTLDKNQAYKLQSIVEAVDTKAFTFISETKEVVGYFD